MILLITLLLVLPAINWLGTLGMVFAGILWKVPVEEVSFGFGKKLFSLTLGGTEVNFRILVIGSFCRFQNTEHELDVPLSLEPTKGNYPNAFNYKSPIIRFLIVLAGPLCIFATAFGICQNGAFNEIASGLSQLWKGTLSPFEVMPEYFRKYVELVNKEGWINGIGLVAAKMTSVQLVPVLSSGVAQALMQLLPQKKQNAIVGSGWNALVMFGFMVVSMMWIIGLIWAAFAA